MKSACLLLCILVGLQSSAAADDQLPRRWVYLQMNLQVPENVERAKEILNRAADSGYNGVVLADYKLNILDRVPEFYFDHARQFREHADSLGIEIIPTVAPFGYSDGLLAHDPNLAEGMPVREAQFVVRNGEAVLEQPEILRVPGGGFEEHQDHMVAGWNFQDAPGASSFVDTEVKHSGESSLRWENPGMNSTETGGNARVSQLVHVQPWRQYHLSVWIKSEDYASAGSVRLFAMTGDGLVLSHSNLGVQQTQDWTQHHVIFNSLGGDEVRIYCGTWGGQTGTLWMDDLVMEETAFVNLLRRDGCPLVVRGGDGTVMEEGRDFAELIDPQLGQVPWAGNFDVYHEPPTLTILPGSRIKEGETLWVDFFHTVTIYDNQVTCCLADPAVFQILEQQVQSVEELFEPRTYFLSHDEIRVANWCNSCNRDRRTAGALLAENMRNCVRVIRGINPDADLCVWSDMFDPHHNAHDDFYLVNGSLEWSWEGLPDDMIIINWNHEQAADSLAFFGRLGHRQVLSGYYDHDPRDIRSWLDLGGDTSGIDGAMYTTWQDDFSQLETFAEAAWGRTP
jgi:hypothetical protein